MPGAHSTLCEREQHGLGRTEEGRACNYRWYPLLIVSILLVFLPLFHSNLLFSLKVALLNFSLAIVGQEYPPSYLSRHGWWVPIRKKRSLRFTGKWETSPANPAQVLQRQQHQHEGRLVSSWINSAIQNSLTRSHYITFLKEKEKRESLACILPSFLDFTPVVPHITTTTKGRNGTSPLPFT